MIAVARRCLLKEVMRVKAEALCKYSITLKDSEASTWSNNSSTQRTDYFTVQQIVLHYRKFGKGESQAR